MDTHSSVIVPEVLKRDNYKQWSIFMRHYLVGQDLWDVVQLSQLPAGENMSREWIKKNALALHAIKISCGKEMFDQIKEMDSAKQVWDALTSVVSQEIVELPVERRTGIFTAQASLAGPGNLERSQYETLTNAISNGNLSEVEKFFAENPNAKSARIFEKGYTALHFAVYNGKARIVDYLIQSKLSHEELEIKDDFGSTALSIAARFGIGKLIAQKLVRKNLNLLTIPDNDGKIPVQLACCTIHEDMALYLYYETPLEFLKEDRGFYILQECIIRKMFHIAFDLLHHCPELASHNCSSSSIPLILTLAQTPPPFFKGSNLPFWEHWIYDCIRVTASVIKEDEHRSCEEKIQDFFQPRVQKIRDFYESCSDMITDLFQSCGEMILNCFQSCGETIQKVFFTSFKDFCGNLLGRAALFIFGTVPITLIVLPIAVLGISVSLIGMLAVIILSMPLILGKLILVVLRKLVSILSRFLAKHLYELKLMDDYAREVIRFICQPLSNLDQNQFMQSRALEATFQAIKNGIPNIVKEITQANATVLWSSIDLEDSRNIFASAIAHRQEEAARLLYEFAKDDVNIVIAIDNDRNNTLHLAAKLAPHYLLDCISGAALQLQSELRWFKGVEEIVPRSYNEQKNKDSETPFEVFVREHKDLLKEAEEWVKKTAESSTVVGALIITIMFAAAFTVPGGNDQSTGFPIFLHKTPFPFLVFMVSDAISLFAASNSVLMFLGILTSRYAYEDFLKTLPIRLILGLSSLFISIATMTTSFCAALFIMLQGRLGVVILITLLAGIPVTFFVLLQFPLLVEICVSTFSPNIFKREEKSWMSTMTGLLAWGLEGIGLAADLLLAPLKPNAF